MTGATRDVRILHVCDCPNLDTARRRVDEAVTSLGIDARVREILVATEADATALGFRGSPTILIDDRDPFENTGPDHLGCRLYNVGDRIEGAPSVAQLRTALRNAAMA